jgi:hypothetical protein
MSLPLKHILIPGQQVFALSPLYCVHSSEATNTNFIIFGLTQNYKNPAKHVDLTSLCRIIKMERHVIELAL